MHLTNEELLLLKLLLLIQSDIDSLNRAYKIEAIGFRSHIDKSKIVRDKIKSLKQKVSALTADEGD